MVPRFTDKVALVIGGSSGIGLAIARGLLAEGAAVTIAARDEARLATVGKDLLDQHPGRVAWVPGDVGVFGEADRFVAQLELIKENVRAAYRAGCETRRSKERRNG